MTKKNKSKEDFDFEKYQEQVVKGLMAGKGLLGEEGLLKPLIARFVETALDAEITHHLEEEKQNPSSASNKRNGKWSKKVRTESGEVEISYHRDRQGFL